MCVCVYIHRHRRALLYCWTTLVSIINPQEFWVGYKLNHDQPYYPQTFTSSGWLSGERVRLSHGRSWVCARADSYQRQS